MTIATPIITDFDKENIAPWSGNRLIDLSMAALPSKPFARFFPWNKNALNLSYQKLRPRYEPMDETTQTACEPLCQEGWYFDCETETCKEYDWYRLTPTGSGGVIIAQTSEGEKTYYQDSMHAWDWGFTVNSRSTSTKTDLISGNYVSYSLYQLNETLYSYADLNAIIDSYLIDTSFLYTNPSGSSRLYSHNQTIQLYSVEIKIPMAFTFGNY